MKLLLINFALRNTFRDYNPFHVAVRGNALNWLQFFDNSYVVSTAHDVSTFTAQLLGHMEATDSLLIVEVQPHQFQA